MQKFDDKVAMPTLTRPTKMGRDIGNSFRKELSNNKVKNKDIKIKENKMVNSNSLKTRLKEKYNIDFDENDKVVSVPELDGVQENKDMQELLEKLYEYSKKNEYKMMYEGKEVIDELSETTTAGSAGGYVTPKAWSKEGDLMQEQLNSDDIHDDKFYSETHLSDMDYRVDTLEDILSGANERVTDYLDKVSSVNKDTDNLDIMDKKQFKHKEDVETKGDMNFSLNEKKEPKHRKETKKFFEDDLKKEKQIEKMQKDGQMGYDYDDDSLKRKEMKQRHNTHIEDEQLFANRGYGMEDFVYPLGTSEDWDKRWVDTLDPKLKERIKKKHKQREKKPEVTEPYVNLNYGVNNLKESFSGVYINGFNKRVLKNFQLSDISLQESVDTKEYRRFIVDGMPNDDKIKLISEDYELYTNGTDVVAINRNQSIILEEGIKKEKIVENKGVDLEKLRKLTFYER